MIRAMLILALGLGGCAAGAGGPAETQWPYAVARPDCAPWDGPATAMLLSESPIADPPVAPYLSFSVYRSVTRMEHRSRVQGKQADGMAATFCPRDGACLPADDGWIDLSLADSIVVGRYSLRVPDGRELAGRFAAPMQNRPILCG
jgi:hypothetical protein